MTAPPGCGDRRLGVAVERGLGPAQHLGVADRKMKLAPPVKMSLEECLEHVSADEYVEVTPMSIRMRKSILDENERKKAAKRARLSVEGA